MNLGQLIGEYQMRVPADEPTKARSVEVIGRVSQESGRARKTRAEEISDLFALNGEMRISEISRRLGISDGNATTVLGTMIDGGLAVRLGVGRYGPPKQG